MRTVERSHLSSASFFRKLDISKITAADHTNNLISKCTHFVISYDNLEMTINKELGLVTLKSPMLTRSLEKV